MIPYTRHIIPCTHMWYIRTHVCTYVHIYTHVCTHIYMDSYLNTCVYIHRYRKESAKRERQLYTKGVHELQSFSYTHVSRVCTCIYMCVHTHTCAHIHTDMYDIHIYCRERERGSSELEKSMNCITFYLHQMCIRMYIHVCTYTQECAIHTDMCVHTYISSGERRQ